MVCSHLQSVFHHLTFFRQTAERVAALNSRLFNIRLGNFECVQEPITLGQLSGNLFIITLRGVEAKDDAHIAQAAQGLTASGFINYFGLQRFGVGSVPTHAVGAALLRGDWAQAVDLILLPREGEQRDDAAEARRIWKATGNAEQALAKMPRQMVSEYALLEGLKRSPSNLVQAVGCIPRTMRMMYVHSYQSFLWNHAASHRVSKYGSAGVVVGDLVHAAEVEREVPSEAEVFPEADEGEGDGESIAEVVVENTRNVKLVSEDDVAAGRYSIEDVLLPLPGGSIVYPATDVAEVYHSLAAKDGVDLYKCSHNVKEYSVAHLKGAYRRLLLRPRDCSWRIIPYEDVNLPLVQTDLDRLTAASNAESSKALVSGNEKQEEPTAPEEAADNPSSCGSMKVNPPVSSQNGTAHEPLSGKGAPHSVATTKPGAMAPIAAFEGDKSPEKPDTEALVGLPPARRDGGHTTNLAEDAHQVLQKSHNACGDATNSSLPTTGYQQSKGRSQLAFQIEFQLPPSSYATMAIRELLKSSSAVSYHRTLNEASDHVGRCKEG